MLSKRNLCFAGGVVCFVGVWRVFAFCSLPCFGPSAVSLAVGVRGDETVLGT